MKRILLFGCLLTVFSLSVAYSNQVVPAGHLDAQKNSTMGADNSHVGRGSNKNRDTKSGETTKKDRVFIDEIVVLQHPVEIKYVIERTSAKTYIDPDWSITTLVDKYSFIINTYINNSLFDTCEVDGSHAIFVCNTENNFFTNLADFSPFMFEFEKIADLREEKLLPCNKGTLKLHVDALDVPKMIDLRVNKLDTDEQGRTTYEVSYYLTMDIKTSIEIDSNNKAINLKANNLYRSYDILGSAENPVKIRFKSEAAPKNKD